MPTSLPRILVLTTGGTISMVRDGDGSLVPRSTAGDFLAEVPELGRIAELDVLEVANIDSADLTPSLWVELAKAIYDRLEHYDGFVVAHGTDTLVYTAAALSFMLQELPKPVVITGAQVPLSDLGSDGRANLVSAVRVATADLAEVVVAFGTLVIRGTRAKKVSAFDLQAFQSANVPPVGTLGLTLKLSPTARPRARRKALYQPFLESRVAMLPVYPGLSPDLVRHAAATHRGLVLEGYGLGTIPTGPNSIVPAINEATAGGVTVVVCTQCFVGSTEMELYKVGRAALSAGALPALDMTPEATLVKLMWVLGQTHEARTIESLMQKNVAGELYSGA